MSEANKDEHHDRVFLVVLDESEELHNALRFAARRALHTHGRVALLGVIEPAEFQHWLGIGRMMEAEARASIRQRLEDHAATVEAITGTKPTLYLREGDRREELLKLLNANPEISLLVLGTAAGGKGPGPLVTYLVGAMGDKLRVPVTLVPGALSISELDEVT